MHGFTAEAQAFYEEAVQLWESAVAERGDPFQAPAAGSYLAAGHFDVPREQARQCRDRSLKENASGDLGCLATLGYIAAREGDDAEARRIAAILEAEVSMGDPLYTSMLQQRAKIAAILNDRERAVELLRQALADGLRHCWLRLNGVDLMNLRGYPPFETLLKGSTF